MQETRVQSLSWDVRLKKGMANHYGFLAWRISWTEREAWQATVPWGLKESGMTEGVTEMSKPI